MSTLIVPDQEQLKAVRARGADVRAARAQLKRDIRSRQLSVPELHDRLLRRDKILGFIRLGQFLECFPAIGPTKRDDICRRLGVEANRRLSGLGPRQVDGLFQHLNDRFGSRQANG